MKININQYHEQFFKQELYVLYTTKKISKNNILKFPIFNYNNARINILINFFLQIIQTKLLKYSEKKLKNIH